MACPDYLPQLPQRSYSSNDLHDYGENYWKYSIYGHGRLGPGGPMLFTGPDGLWDHRVRVQDEYRYVGEGTMSPLGTSEAAYLWRAPRDSPHPKPKSARVGEVGWGVPMFTDWGVPQSGRQIQLGEFRQWCEDRHTHLFQNPWYPGPNDPIDQDPDDVMVMNVYRSPTRTRSSASIRRTRRPMVPAATPLYSSGYGSQMHSGRSRPLRLSQSSERSTEKDGYSEQSESNYGRVDSGRPDTSADRPLGRSHSRGELEQEDSSYSRPSSSQRGSHSRTSSAGRKGARSSLPDY
ncbi:uncharacterized protein LOC106158587 [Lingula anatina]|uniref:Uncharacterized protein LOC106158587 n=1 Tax=Lingula anatina TaxID=7574 RepID=A0A1S3HYE3_LINAN|nr:uncharacterized protein LOC106158587 [Lingula anatina]|eukprot:XP_013390094.1 uncharacterized protein LOC106158587 [Lingula anatina]